MRTWTFLTALALLAACTTDPVVDDTDTDTDVEDTGDTSDTSDTGDTSDTSDTGDTGDTGATGSLVGSLTYVRTHDSVVVCNTTVSLVGTPYSGTCTGCDFAFDIAATITSETGTDCDGGDGSKGFSPANRWTFLDQSIPVPGYSPVVFYDGAISYQNPYVYGSYSYYNSLLLGRTIDYLGLYTWGPYWYPLAYTYDAAGTQPWPSGTLSWDGTSALAWTVDVTSQGEEDLYYDDSAGTPASSSATAAYGGTANPETLDCDGNLTDVWRITVTTGETVGITVNTVADATAFDPEFWVNDPTGATIAETDDNFTCAFGDLTSALCPSYQFTAAATGTYEVVVRSAVSGCGVDGSGTGGVDTAAYELMVEATTTAPAPIINGDDRTDAEMVYTFDSVTDVDGSATLTGKGI